MAADVGIPFRLTEVDGVPCFWADAQGPCTAGLLFRVGRADELLWNSGLTHLVEHLALYELGRQRYDYNGQVDATTTSFYATGEPAEVVAFVAHVCGAVAGLPAGRLDAEKRILAIEEQRADRGVAERLLMMRFGAAGHGLPFYDQMGLRWLRADDVGGWARQWFTRGNAVLWMTHPPPAGLRVPLPDGPRMPPPEPRTTPGLELPAYAAAGTGCVASTLLARRSTAIGIATRTVADRAHTLLRMERGLSYDVAAFQFPLTGDLSHRSLAVDCMEGQGREVVEGVTAIYEALAAEGPTPEELRHACEASLRALRDPDAVPGGLDYMAVNELLGGRRLWKDDLAREAEVVTYAEVAAALREALATQIMLGPSDAPRPSERLRGYPAYSGDRVAGRELRTGRRGAAARLVVGQEGVSRVDETGRVGTVRFADLAAALQESDGSLTLIGRDGAAVAIEPHVFRGAGEVVGDLERTLPPHLLIPPRDALSGHRGGVEQLARRKLHRRRLVESELKLLGSRLDHDEALVTLAQASMGFKPGLLALTDRRVIWLHSGDREEVQRELPYGEVLDVRSNRFPKDTVTLRSGVGETAFAHMRPKERTREVVEEIQRRVAAARAARERAAPPPPAVQ